MIPTNDELTEAFPLPIKYRWKIIGGGPIRRVYIQKKAHFLGLFYWQNVAWTVFSETSKSWKWRANRLRTENNLEA